MLRDELHFQLLFNSKTYKLIYVIRINMTLAAADSIEVREIKDTLTEVVLELQKRYPSLTSHSYPISTIENRKGAGIVLSDPHLRETMSDAYPTSLADGFAMTGVLEPEYGAFEIYQRFDFGRERTPERLQTGGESDTNPRQVVRGISHKFAKAIRFPVEDHKFRGRFAFSMIYKISIHATLEEVREAVIGNVGRYIEHGKANAAPK